MENGNFIEKLAALFGQNASVKNVYGEPVKVGDKTIIPVAQIAYGLGGGYGQKKGNRKKPPLNSEEASLPEENKPLAGEGAGGGGGLYAKPNGVYEVTANGTRFIPAHNAKELLMAAAIGFLIRGWLRSGSRNKYC
jgi:uncharacterized spore protein YtfJ